jgi:hypothetical protein
MRLFRPKLTSDGRCHGHGDIKGQVKANECGESPAVLRNEQTAGLMSPGIGANCDIVVSEADGNINMRHRHLDLECMPRLV